MESKLFKRARELNTEANAERSYSALDDLAMLWRMLVHLIYLIVSIEAGEKARRVFE